MGKIDFLLHESALGYAIFKVVHQQDTVGLHLKEVQQAGQDLAKFGKMVQLVNFAPWRNAADALENINLISEGILPDYLKSDLELNLPQAKKSKIVLGVADKNLAGSIKAEFPSVECETGDTSEVVADLLRGVRLHAAKLLKGLEEGDVERAQLGLGHAYSRGKVKFNVHKNDNHIIKAIATLDNLDKGINLFSQKVREWYGWHFPELYSIVSDNLGYARMALYIGDKSSLSEDKLHELAALVGEDEDKASEIINKAKISMGREISSVDMDNISSFAGRVVKLAEYRKTLYSYLVDKMDMVAPNLATLIGEVVAARLIQKAGSLTNLSKYPASTLQILGAEKALFRALKTKGNTPKFGLIYHSTYIGRANPKDKGRISRYLANKCSIAARIDNFAENPSKKFGEALRSQVEDRLEFYATGKKPKKNEDAMAKAMEDVLADGGSMAIDTDMIDDPLPATAVTAATEEKKSKKVKKEKKDKKEKKRKHSDVGVEEPEAVDGEKKKKKKKRQSEVSVA
ncbi:pre-rRNA processing nucleolar protein-like protein Sik1 [Pseudomassariella vexata]|uniref:Nucleolar protein 56 n=1 Tax=Pseudomassariella vexata TaxID=1141098 RepID=A0A1Y2EA53_9PEZI|nr:pre-rRNA processing nucleolar protein-like protein Sik1 [Pseudomassariella vexata]ORY68277.1 pre-rRNA processing nucleolar protein-like protein Sik1 [Pseudomassariella vexata]